MTITGRWMCPTYNKIAGFEFDVAAMPRWRDGKRRTYTHAVGFAMSRECRIKDVAWRFLRYLGSPASQRQAAQWVKRRAASTSTAMSARSACTPWKRLIGLPNCLRSAA